MSNIEEELMKLIVLGEKLGFSITEIKLEDETAQSLLDSWNSKRTVVDDNVIQIIGPRGSIRLVSDLFKVNQNDQRNN